ncbi:MAG: glycosyltransferase [Candidatus Lokiarchaeota archaeon]|nr:glycosyltransferase [Candidatus Lokiarchaeota archaeon]
MSLISIIIPTTRPEMNSLKSFFQFEIPEGYDLEYIFIIDDPSKSTENLESIIEEFPDVNVNIIKNEENVGVSASRNVGIQRSKGNYILSLDDDCIAKSDLLIEYIRAVKKYPEAPGYIGLTSAPEPINSFQEGIIFSDMLHFFQIAKHKEEFFWGITANLFLKRKAIGDVRFPINHPKKGGGEDIFFCLKILDNHNQENNNSNLKESSDISMNKRFKCVETAEVVHPFWKESFRSYMRFFRWGYGDILLHSKFPQFKYHQFPNLIELSFITLLVYILTISINIIFSFLNLEALIFIIFITQISICITWEILWEAFKLHKRNLDLNVIALIKAVFIRQLNDLGRFVHLFPRIWKITNRWDYFCTRESLDYERKIALRKFLGFCLTFLVLYLVFMIYSIK